MAVLMERLLGDPHWRGVDPDSPQAADWTSPATCPLSVANDALPWILFARDKATFRVRFPGLSLVRLQPDMPFCYLLSGGIA